MGFKTFYAVYNAILPLFLILSSVSIFLLRLNKSFHSQNGGSGGVLESCDIFTPPPLVSFFLRLIYTIFLAKRNGIH